jgi:phosphinothricin acetyltransferase
MSGKTPIIRPSRDDDVAAVTAIYGYHVPHGVASFEEVPPGEDEMRRRRGEIVARGLPYLVA